MAVAIVVARRLSILRAQEARRRREPARRPDRDSRRQARFERIMETAPTPMLHRELSPPPPPPRRPWDASDDAVLLAAVTAALAAAERERARVHWGRVARAVQDACGQILTGAEVRERYARTVAALDGPQRCALAPEGLAVQAEARFAEPLAVVRDAGDAKPPRRRSRFSTLFDRRRPAPREPLVATAIEVAGASAEPPARG